MKSEIKIGGGLGCGSFQCAVWIAEFFEECVAAGGFFGGDAELFADAGADVFPTAGQWAEVIAGAAILVVVGDAEFGVGGLAVDGRTPHPGPLPLQGRGRRGAVFEGFFAEGGVAFGELKVAFGGLFFVGLFAEVEGDFVGVHFGSAAFFGLGALFAGEFDFGALGAEFGAGGEVGEALEGEELGGGVAAGADGFHGFEEDGVVDFFGGGVLAARASIAGGDGVELGEGEFLAGGEVGVDSLDGFDAFPEDFEGAVGDEVEAEAAFGAWFVDAGAEVGVGGAVEELGELFELGVGEGGEGWLATLFSHKTVVEKGGIKGLGGKMGDGRGTVAEL